MTSEYTFKSVGISEIPDLTKLFEGRGGPHYCWCSLWRRGGRRSGQTKEEKKACLLDAIHTGTQVGLLAYSEDEPIAWCSVGPRDTFRSLGGNEDLTNVWSIVCFFVLRSYRGKGLAKALLEESIALSQKHGAEYLEAYPAAADGTSYRFMGKVPMYEAADFSFLKMAGKRRHVMIRKL